MALESAVGTLNTAPIAASPRFGLVDEPKMIEIVWPDEKSRPSAKYIQRLRLRRQIPFLRIGRLIYYEPEKVLQSFQKRFEVSMVGGK